MLLIIMMISTAEMDALLFNILYTCMCYNFIYKNTVDLLIICSNRGLSARATVTAGSRYTCPCHVPVIGLDRHWLVK